MNRHHRALALVFVALASLLIGGCGGAQGSVAPQTATAGDAQAVARKYDAYIEGYNELVDIIFGLRQAYTRYRELGIAQASPDRDLYFNAADTTVRHAIASLRTARTIPTGDATAADRAADALLPTLERIQRRYDTLGPYYATKAYRKDRLARGRAEDAALLSDYESALKQMDRLGRELDAYRRDSRSRAHASTAGEAATSH